MVVNNCRKKPILRKNVSVYFDTPDLNLFDAGVSLRVRRTSGRWIQTIKVAGKSLAGLHQRDEWEDPIAKSHPDFTKIIEPSLLKLFSDRQLRETIKPIFQTEVHRSTWQLCFDNGDEVELVMDVGQVISNQHVEPISEIELELKSGNKRRLFDITLALMQDIPLTINNKTKSERGYAYYRLNTPAVFKGKSVKLSSNADIQSTFKKVVLACLDHLQSNQEMVLYGTDVEGVHQMRVALRRMRSAFSVFRKLVNDVDRNALLVELEWLADILGQVRDLDVLITQTLPAIIGVFPHHSGLLELRDIAIHAQEETYIELRKAINSQRYQCLLISLAAWLEKELFNVTIKNGKKHPLLSFASSVLNKRHKRLQLLSKRFLVMSSEERHGTRISIKKFRYAMEFFTSLYPSGNSRSFINRLSQLQKYLGLLNDIATTEKLVQQLTGKKPSQVLKEALYILSGFNECYRQYCINQSEKALRKLLSQKPFWDA
jgi:inorganic triphosphatase YgiF